MENLQFITQNMACGVMRCSDDLRYLWVNLSYATWLGRTPDEITGRTILDILGPTAYERIRPRIEEALSGKKQEFEVEEDLPGIGPRYIHAVYMPTRGLDDKVDGWIAVVTDITDARRLHEASAARQKLESVGMLASGIAHDFNNLLGGVLAQAELALGELAAGLRPEEQLKAIRDVAIRGSEIVRELMIYAGKDHETRELVDLSELVSEMLQLLKISVSKHATLETDLGEDLPAIWANAAQLRQIVMNLVTNASEALGERDGAIRVTTRCAKVDPGSSVGTSDRLAGGDYLQLEISDTGSGMSPETQARVFDPFFTTKSAGHGLGLAVVSGIVRGLGGAIHLSSELGWGTTFQILLPSAEAAGHGTSSAPRTSEDGADSPGSAVLVVEDEDLLRGAVVKMLRKQGFEVFEAADGSSAIEFLRTKDGNIDAILLDVTIPGASSREVATEAAKAHPHIKLVLTSAYSPDVITRAVDAPTTVSFIRKPYKIADLVQTLWSVLSS
jgi:PAS domain S-box-containing protein